MLKTKRHTILDVARTAGVSPATVSRAFNNPTLLQPETLTRVRQAASQLRFVPNALARGLITGRSGFIALVVPDITDPFFAHLAYAVESRLRAEGFVLIVCHTGEQRSEEAELTRLLEEHQIDGLIYASEALSGNGPSPLEASRLPRVYVERQPRRGRADTVILSKEGVQEVVDYLVGLGHRDIAMVTGHPNTYGGRELLAAFRVALKRSGVRLPAQYVVSGDFNFDQSRAAAAQLLGLARPPTAVFVGSDRMAHAFMIGLADCGVHVPDDLSVVAFATALVDRLVYPMLTNCQSSYEQVGHEAADLLVNRLRHPDSPWRQVSVPTRLLLRASCRTV
jgi:LacI family transcriptional regulator